MDAQVPPAQGGRASSRDLRRAGGVRPGQARQPLDPRVRRLYEGRALLVARPGTGDDLPALGGDSAQRGSVQAVPLQRLQLPAQCRRKIAGRRQDHLDSRQGVLRQVLEPAAMEGGGGAARRRPVDESTDLRMDFMEPAALHLARRGRAGAGMVRGQRPRVDPGQHRTVPDGVEENGKAVLRVYLVNAPAKLQGSAGSSSASRPAPRVRCPRTGGAP